MRGKKKRADYADSRAYFPLTGSHIWHLWRIRRWRQVCVQLSLFEYRTNMQSYLHHYEPYRRSEARLILCFLFLHVGINRRQAGKDLSFPSRGSGSVWVRMRHSLSVPEWLSPVHRLSMRILNIYMGNWFERQVMGA